MTFDNQDITDNNAKCIVIQNNINTIISIMVQRFEERMFNYANSDTNDPKLCCNYEIMVLENLREELEQLR
jgi:hypothetical protein